MSMKKFVYGVRRLAPVLSRQVATYESGDKSSHSTVLMRSVPGEESHSVRQDGLDYREALGHGFGRAGEIDDQRGTSGARNASTQVAERSFLQTFQPNELTQVIGPPFE